MPTSEDITAALRRHAQHPMTIVTTVQHWVMLMSFLQEWMHDPNHPALAHAILESLMQQFRAQAGAIDPCLVALATPGSARR